MSGKPGKTRKVKKVYQLWANTLNGVIATAGIDGVPYLWGRKKDVCVEDQGDKAIRVKVTIEFGGEIANA